MNGEGQVPEAGCHCWTFIYYFLSVCGRSFLVQSRQSGSHGLAAAHPLLLRQNQFCWPVKSLVPSCSFWSARPGAGGSHRTMSRGVTSFLASADDFAGETPHHGSSGTGRREDVFCESAGSWMPSRLSSSSEATLA